MDHLDPKHRRWLALAERAGLILVLILIGMWLGWIIGLQGSARELAAADKRLIEERSDRLEEIRRMQESYGIALTATGRAMDRMARRTEKTADKVEKAAEQAEVAAAAAKGAATRATRSAPPAAAGVNETVRDANRKLGAGK